MDLWSSNKSQEGNEGEAQQRRMVLDIDLNSPPYESTNDSPELQDQGNQGQATNAVDDDEVVVISPRKFEEATKNSRRKHRLTDDSLKDCLLINNLSTGNLDAQTAFGQELVLSNGVGRFSCGICMEELSEETSTKCGHIFCKKCITKAIAEQHKCPTCRRRLTKRDTFRLYFPKSD